MPRLLKFLRYLLTGRAQRVFCAQLFTAAVVFGVGWSLWSSLKPKICGGSDYRIEEKNIRVWNPPVWVSNNFIREALALRTPDERRKELNALDPNLGESLALAFGSHPWVQKVKKIEVRFPGRVDVWLQFKKPIAVVDPTYAFEVVSEDDSTFSIDGDEESKNKAKNEIRRVDEKYIVDADGYRLPDGYFRENTNAYRDFLCILGIHSTPVSESGQCFDPLVVEAAAFADFLEQNDVPRKMKIDRVFVTKKVGTSKGVYALKTKNNTTIRWGYFAPPKKVSSSTPTFDADVKTDEKQEKEAKKKILFEFQKKKLEQLVKNIAAYSSIDDVPREESALLDVSETLDGEDR